MADSKNADMMTVLRHLVDNTQWQGNHGARAETQDAMDRLMGGNYDADDSDDDKTQDATAKAEPDISGGSRAPSAAAKRNAGPR
jgi:hypothetical protein